MAPLPPQHQRRRPLTPPLLFALLRTAFSARQWRLPHHRIRSPGRTVDYPANHPLGRHLRPVLRSRHDDTAREYESDEYIVGGDGWSLTSRNLQKRRLHSINERREERRERILQQHPPADSGSGSRYYWSVTGRNLVNEKDELDRDESLLVDALTSDEDADNNDANNNESANEEIASDRQYSDAVEESTFAEEENSYYSTRQTDSEYQPIRLRAVLTDDFTSGSQYLTLSQRRVLMEDIINPALYAWSKALHVVPVLGGLVVDRGQLFDGVSCGPGLDSGLPSVKVPNEHLTEGLSDTDTVIYISISFSDQTTPTTPDIFTRTYLYGGQDGPIYRNSNQDESYDKDTTTKENFTDHPSYTPSQTPTIPPSEITQLNVESLPQCPGNYLASATHCSTDQYDRPVAGLLSICIDDIHTFFSSTRIKRNRVTIIHEIGHILGFNAESLAHFRDGSTGEPLTARDESGNVPDVTVECSGVNPRVEARIPLPSENITVFNSVRGGVRSVSIVTPTVRRVARNMFGCQSLNGAELESGEWQLFGGDADELSAGECIGDHWERRLFRTDLMNPIVDDVSYSLYISSLTLAYFADSGWYKVDTRRIAPSSVWGRNAGCNFVNSKCVTRHGQVAASNNAFFCNNFRKPETETDTTNNKSTRSNSKEDDDEPEQEIHGCDLDSSSKAVCSIVEYEMELPDEYSYFGHTKYVGGDLIGGSDPTLDYCPVFQGYSNGKCASEEAAQYVGVKSSLEVFGQNNSRCVIGNVDRKRTALCLPMACVIQDQTLMVKVDGYWKRCLYAGQIISMWWNRKDYVVCPDPSHLCPTFYCPNDCFKESGVCDYRVGQCMCAPLPKMNTTSPTSWLSTYYSTPILEPCSGSHAHNPFNGTFHVAERIDVELPEYYVKNTTFLQDDPRDFDDKMSRMFAQLSSGEVVGLVASFMLFIMFSYLIWFHVVKCYKQRLLGSSLTKVRTSVSSLSGLLRNTSLASLNRQSTDDNDADTDSPPTNRRPPGQGNPQKDKMVATLLVQNRIESTALAERIEQQTRLELAGMADSQTEQSQVSSQLTFINRSELPPLPQGGRVLAVIGAQIIEDDTRETRSTVTTASHLTTRDDISEYTSPLYQDEDDEQQSGVQRYLRLRHGNTIRQLD